MIFTLRNKQVMLDSDLAELYQVETKVLNQAVKRNTDRFPEGFRFQLQEADLAVLRSQIVTSTAPITASRSQIVTLNKKKGLRFQYLPPMTINIF
jgi:2-phospho-L-lactate guanylyltransferase (CobY/MobA/RfbA family)